MRNLILFLLLLPLVLFAAATPEKWHIGQAPPDELGRDRNGHAVRLSDTSGQVVLVTFWASWCAPCIKELPILEGIQHMAGAKRLRVIAVNFQEDRDKFRRMAVALKNAELILTSDTTGKISNAYGVYTLPHMFMLDHTGKIVAIHAGYSEDALPDLVAEINKLLVAQGNADSNPAISTSAPANQ